MLYSLARHVLFRMDAEKAHHTALKLLQKTYGSPLGALIKPRVADNPVSVMGLEFSNPVGLSAGLDKDGDYLAGLGALGFGFIEIGTVTPRPQPGNPQPRLFRLPEAGGIINRMGFNNLGVDHLVEQVRQRRYEGVLGINIGKNKDTPNEQANDDYLHCLEKVYPYADYVTVNISSPNTPGLRELQHGAMLDELFAALKQSQEGLCRLHGKYVPIAVKIAPDMEDTQIDEFAQAVLHHGIDGVIATNTTMSRDGVTQLPHGKETGGLSGRPLTSKSTLVISRLGTTLAGKTPIIGVGGIFSAADAQAKIDAGASLVQIYTGFIYQGPKLIRDIASQLNLQD
ncbi:quinone-dependent dihydroorotate dehydrogenase [Granulosicoccaceae sp. 1_MG-2023]|nr:quinone-dependent dihydroorotate dehydrogenase [Granulosicoccaceae sp. 1_MG-2023]